MAYISARSILSAANARNCRTVTIIPLLCCSGYARFFNALRAVTISLIGAVDNRKRESRCRYRGPEGSVQNLAATRAQHANSVATQAND
ncbi:MAG: hypothetical protein V7629_05910 [Motiliproteus sp.]